MQRLGEYVLRNEWKNDHARSANDNALPPVQNRRCARNIVGRLGRLTRNSFMAPLFQFNGDVLHVFLEVFRSYPSWETCGRGFHTSFDNILHVPEGNVAIERGHRAENNANFLSYFYFLVRY